ncbi:MAG: DUF2185 domain-containing protein [Candidatus Kapabacteria bacterium]|jgi:hypothetical protein|nr:DUF2185 domain-containing protein [Candidatus Kapabacteria bacterium]
MATKQFKLTAEQIKPLAEGYGACFATDKITVEGRNVGFMYREEPDYENDSGWRFLAGDETGEYMNEADNVGVYDVNTIANYDEEIIPFLDADEGTAFARDKETGEFFEVEYDDEDDEE